MVYEIMPVVVLLAWPAFDWIALQVQADRPPNTETHLSTPKVREISAQGPRDAAALFAAADAIDREGHWDKVPHVLQAAERQLLAGSLGESAPVPATVGEAIEFEKSNSSPPLYFLRERAFKELLEATIAPRAGTDKGAHVDLVNRSSRSIRDLMVLLDVGVAREDRITLECSADMVQPPGVKPLEWRPKETLRFLCAPIFPGQDLTLQPAFEGAEKQRLHPVPVRVMFSDAPFWIERNGGAKIPEAWPGRPKARATEVPKLQQRPCEAAGTCRDMRWIFDVYLRTTGQNEMVKLFLLAMMTGLITCAIARRIFKDEARFRPARLWISIAGVVVAGLLFVRGEYWIFAIPFAALAYAGWFAGFRTGVRAFQERAVSA